MCGCDGCCHDDIPGDMPQLSPAMIKSIEESCGMSIEEIRATPLAETPWAIERRKIHDKKMRAMLDEAIASLEKALAAE